MVNYWDVRQERLNSVKNLLQTKGLRFDQVDKNALARLVQEARLPAFESTKQPGNFLKWDPLVDACLHALWTLQQESEKQQPRSLKDKALIISYIEETKTILEEVCKRLEHLENLLKD